jgi:hypothetical protein
MSDSRVCEVEGCSNLAEYPLTAFGPKAEIMEELKSEGKDIPAFTVFETPFGEKYTIIIFRVCEQHKNEDEWSRINYDRHCDMKLRRGDWVTHHYKEGIR